MEILESERFECTLLSFNWSYFSVSGVFALEWSCTRGNNMALFSPSLVTIEITLVR